MSPSRRMRLSALGLTPEQVEQVDRLIDAELETAGARLAALLVQSYDALRPAGMLEAAAVVAMRRSALVRALEAIGTAECLGAVRALVERWRHG